MALQFRSIISMNGSKITNIGAPTAASNDAARIVDVETASTNDRARTNHTGTQTASTISDFNTAVRTNRLDQMASPTADVSFNNIKGTNLADPTAAQDAVNKRYVDNFVNGMAWKESVRMATAAALAAGTYSNGTAGVGATFTASANGVMANVDGVTPAVNDRILVKDQATALQNGVYVVTSVGAAGAPFVLTRALDADEAGDLLGAVVPVQEGTANADKAFISTTNAPITMGTTSVAFTQLPGSGGGALTIYEQDIGNGSLTSIPVTHNLGTRKVSITVYRNTTPWEDIYVEAQRTDTNTVTLVFDGTAPSTNEFHVIVTRLGTG
jgi:hypothetical protein